ncbi:MAG: HEAT repeat domain-containing protein [Methanoregula sp.]|jgi:HEAT repeat protein|nr:HEAT repeat domain-containing protein [Methanoregula sp.]
MGIFELFRPDVAQLASQQDAEGLVRALQYNDPAIREEAARALRSLGRKIVPVIHHLLPQADDVLKSQLVQVLVTAENIPIEILLPVIREQYIADRGSMMRIFQSLGENSIPFFIGLFGEKDPDIQEMAIRALAGMKDSSWPLLEKALSLPSYLARQSAAKALTRSGWKPHTEEEFIRFNAAKGDWDELVRMKRSSVTALAGLLSDEYYGIRREAARALGAIGDPRAVPPLCNAIQDSDPEVCISVIEALVALHDRKAVVLFVQTLQHPAYNVRRAAAHALRDLKWSPASDSEKVQYLIASEDWQALTALGKKVIPPLVVALGDSYYSVRQGAADALRLMGTPGKNALVLALKDENPTIRRTATDFLARISKDQQSAVRMTAAHEKNMRETSPVQDRGKTPAPNMSASPSSSLGSSPAAREPSRNRDTTPKPGSDDTRKSLPPRRELPERAPMQEKGRDAAERTLPQVPLTSDQDRPGKTILKVPDPAVARTENSEERNISAIISALHHPDNNVRMIAVESIAKFGEDAIDPLIAALKDPYYLVRCAAAEALGRLKGERAIPALISLLEDPDENVRAAVAKSLGAIGDLLALTPLARALTDEYEAVRSAATEGLAGLGSQAIPFLIQLLGHEKPQIRAGVATTLGMMATRDACEPLAAMFTDMDAIVRENAAIALGHIGTQSIPLLTDALRSADPAIRLCGVTGLGSMGEPGRELLVGACNDPDPVVSNRAQYLIGNLVSTDEKTPSGLSSVNGSDIPGDKLSRGEGAGSPADMLATIRLISHPNKDIQIKAVTEVIRAGESAVIPLIQALINEKNEIRAGAAEALVEIGGPSVIPLVNALPGAPSDAQMWILHALGKLGDSRAITQISKVMDDADPQIKVAATDALGYIGDPSVVGRLARILSDPDEHLRTSAVRALGYIGDPSSAAFLVTALGDEEYRVRDMAQEALFEIGSSAIPTLVEALKSQSPAVRDGAAASLGRLEWKPATPNETVYFLMAQECWIDLARMGADAIMPLSNALENPDDNLRMGAVLTLGKMAGPEPVELLARVLMDRNVMIRQKATMALVDMGAAARQPLSSMGSCAPPELQQAIQQVITRIDRKVQS